MEMGLPSWDPPERPHRSHTLEQCESEYLVSTFYTFSCRTEHWLCKSFGAPSCGTSLHLEHCVDPECGCADIPPLDSIFLTGALQQLNSCRATLLFSYK